MRSNALEISSMSSGYSFSIKLTISTIVFFTNLYVFSIFCSAGFSILRKNLMPRVIRTCAIAMVQIVNEITMFPSSEKSIVFLKLELSANILKKKKDFCGLVTGFLTTKLIYSVLGPTGVKVDSLKSGFPAAAAAFAVGPIH